jgi:hypothetical protein
MRVVGFVGRKGAGKDTAASALTAWRGYVRAAYADQVKELALRINPIVHPEMPDGFQRLDWIVSAYGWDVAKRTSPDVRKLLQELGTGVRDLVGDDAWLNAWDSRVIADHGGAAAVAVPDVRRLNEAEHVRVRGAYGGNLLIRIERPDLDDSDTHVSETEQDQVDCDVTLVNNGTATELRAAVIRCVDAYTYARSVVAQTWTGHLNTLAESQNPQAGPRD